MQNSYIHIVFLQPEQRINLALKYNSVYKNDTAIKT